MFSLKSYYLCITNTEIVQNSKSKPKTFSFLCTFKSAAIKFCTIPDHLAPCFWRNVPLLQKNPLTIWPGKSNSGSPLSDLAGTAVLQKCLSFLVLLLSGGTSNLAWPIWRNSCCTVHPNHTSFRSLHICSQTVYQKIVKAEDAHFIGLCSCLSLLTSDLRS